MFLIGVTVIVYIQPASESLFGQAVKGDVNWFRYWSLGMDQSMGIC
jgi:hypothetical protein